MTAERAYDELVLENQRLAAENADLHRQLERLHIHTGAIGTGVIQRYDAAISQIQEQRDAYHRALFDGLVDAEQHTNGAIAALKSEMMAFEAQNQQYSAPQSLLWIEEATFLYKSVINGQIQTAKEVVLSRGAVTPRQGVERLQLLAQQTGAQLSAVNIIADLRLRMNTPMLVCLDILDELHANGQVKISTTARLDLNWIKQTISSRIGSHQKLTEALEHAYRYRTEFKGRTEGLETAQEEYARKYTISVGTLKSYVPYLGAIIEQANKAPLDYRERHKLILEAFMQDL